MKKEIIWIIQPNQITTPICDFLAVLQERVKSHVTLLFMVPDASGEMMERLKALAPVSFKTTTRTAETSYQGYLAKKNQLQGKEFATGLGIKDVLLLDDLGGGRMAQTFLDIARTENTSGVILQIPTPLGSSDSEERVFHAAVLWAGQNRLPIIGYELLPLDTRWTLAASLPDGIITRCEDSLAYLTDKMPHRNIWRLPLYEAAIFSAVSTQFNVNGAKAAYHYTSRHAIPIGRTILYIPHNVSMVHDYGEMLGILRGVGDQLHLMFGFGEDQVRGAHTQPDIIRTVYREALNDIASYSFHNTNNSWEILMADAVAACSTCFQTVIAEEKNIPCIILDPFLPPVERGHKKRVDQKPDFLNGIKEIIRTGSRKKGFADIIMQLTKPWEKK